MSATRQRDHTAALAKSNPEKALAEARNVSEPWFRAQALSWVARFTDGDPTAITSEAAKAASECDDDYKKSAVRAWEIAALAHRGYLSQARASMNEALALAKCVVPMSSRSEALVLLFQAAMRIGRDEAEKANKILRLSCPPQEHWRCKRALRHAEEMLSGKSEPRPFFW